MKASFDSDITSVGAITLTTPAGEVFQSRPLGLFYQDSASRKMARIASVQSSQGTLYPPNVVVYSNVLSGLKADLMLVWAKNGYEQNLVLKQAPPRPESFGLASATTRLQLWSAMDTCPEPKEQRPVVLNSGLVDHILFFNGCWFPAYLLLNGTVSFPGTSPVIFTSKNDNQYGEIISGSTTMPGYSAAKAIWIYYPTAHTTIQNALVRCAGRGVRYDQSVGGLAPSLSSSVFQRSFIGVELNIPGDTLYLSQVTSCTVPTPISTVNGNVSGSITPDCGVESVAMVNDPNRDLTGPDRNKNSQSECSFVLPDSSTVVAAFWNTHLSEYGLGALGYYFPQITSPRSVGWATSANSGATFVDHGPIPPYSQGISPQPTNGDAGDPVMAYNPDVGGAYGTIYLVVNPSRDSWNGFRLWTSTDKGASFNPVNMNILDGTVTQADKPMIRSYGGQLYIGGTSQTSTTVWAAHSPNGGVSWDSYRVLDTSYPSSGVDIAVASDGTVYFFWLQGTGTQNKLRYARYSPPPGNGWSASYDFGITLNSTGPFGTGKLLRSRTSDPSDYFDSNGFPRVAVANGRIYLVYADLPTTWASTGDRSDVFVAETIVNADHTLAAPLVRVLYVGNASDQWDPSIAVNPSGSEMFVGYYSRQDDPNNSYIMAYGAKANIRGGLANATFDSFPISPIAFPPLFPGTSAPALGGWAYDPVWPQSNVCLDTFAKYDGVPNNLGDCPNYNTQTSSAVNFCADDYTWVSADSDYFYFAWCDRTRNFISPLGTRPDADVQFARIKK